LEVELDLAPPPQRERERERSLVGLLSNHAKKAWLHHGPIELEVRLY